MLKLPTPSLLFAYNYVVFLPLFFKSAPRSFQDSCFEMFASVAHHAMHPFRVGKCGSTRTSKRPASCASSCRNNSAASSASPDLGLAALDQLGETIPKFGSRSLIFLPDLAKFLRLLSRFCKCFDNVECWGRFTDLRQSSGTSRKSVEIQ